MLNRYRPLQLTEQHGLCAYMFWICVGLLLHNHLVFYRLHEVQRRGPSTKSRRIRVRRTRKPGRKSSRRWRKSAWKPRIKSTAKRKITAPKRSNGPSAQEPAWTFRAWQAVNNNFPKDNKPGLPKFQQQNLRFQCDSSRHWKKFDHQKAQHDRRVRGPRFCPSRTSWWRQVITSVDWGTEGR